MAVMTRVPGWTPLQDQIELSLNLLSTQEKQDRKVVLMNVKGGTVCRLDNLICKQETRMKHNLVPTSGKEIVNPGM